MNLTLIQFIKTMALWKIILSLILIIIILRYLVPLIFSLFFIAIIVIVALIRVGIQTLPESLCKIKKIGREKFGRKGK